MKKIISILLTVTMLICGCSSPANVNETEPSNDATSDTTETTTGYENTTDQATTPTDESNASTENSTADPNNVVATPDKLPVNADTAVSQSPTNPPQVDGSHLIEPLGTITANSFEKHGKELKIYGDLSATDNRIIELESLLQSYSKKIGLVAWRKDGTRALSYNTSQSFFSACTIKAGFILNICKIIDSGAVSPDTLLTYEARHWHKGSGSIRYSAYGTKYTVSELIIKCLSISDNVAYKMLLEHFGLSTYNEMVTSLGCNSLKVSKMWAYTALPKDYIIIWNEIYDYLQSNTKMAPVLKEACTNTPFNYGTETLKEGVDYSHKSGDNFGAAAAYSDAGIVWEDNAYIYAVFTHSEGTPYDINLVDSCMELVYNLMK